MSASPPPPPPCSPASRLDSISSRRQSYDGSDTTLDASDSLNVVVLGVCVRSGLTEIDCALLRFSQKAPTSPLHIRMLQHDALPVPSIIRTGVLELLHGAKSSHATMSRANALLGHLFANGIKSFCRKHGIRQSAIHLVGTHAQIPNRVPRLETHNADTHPYGWNRTVATETGITTVFEFNVLECLGTRPFISPVAFADRTLLTHRKKFRVCLNIDQLANLTFIPPSVDQSVSRTQFRECGPGTLFIDYAVRYCTADGTGNDHNGELAAQGNISQEIVGRACNNRYLQTTPPLSMSAEMFGDHEAQHLIDECLAFNLGGADVIATITRITAHNILKQYRRGLKELFPPDQQVDELFICGRGARNPNIIDYLESELPENVITKPLDDVGIPGDANEAVCCAHLAFEAMLCQTTRRPTRSQKESSPRTRQDVPFVGGKVVRGAEWDTLLASIQRFSKGEQLFASTDVRVIQP